MIHLVYELDDSIHWAYIILLVSTVSFAMKANKFPFVSIVLF